MKTCRIVVNGAFGSMGRIACATLTELPEFDLVACLGRGDHLAQVIQANQVDVVVDLTRADCVFENSLAIVRAGARPVIGTSGLFPEQIELLKQECSLLQRGGLIVPNFSIGAVLMMQFASTAARYLSNVEIVEAHHSHKIDAPSGTALKTAECIAQSRGEQAADRVMPPGSRGAVRHGVPIHSLRLEGVLAQQEVIFGQTGETLTLTHRTIDRVSFMPGLVLACRRVMHLNALLYGLEHVMDDFQ